MPLNDLKCRNAKPRPKMYCLYDAGGLYLQVMPNGSKYWRYKYRFNGRERRLAFGIYPAITLLDARNQQAAAKTELQKGIDPALLRKETKQQTHDDNAALVKNVATEWYKENVHRWKPNYSREIWCRLETYLFPVLGNVPIRQVTTPMLYNILKKIELRAPVMAKKLRQKIREIFSHAKNTGKVDINVALDLKTNVKGRKVKHRASIDIDELPEFLKALKAGHPKINSVTHLAMIIMLLTFQRRKELMRAKWCEFDFANAMWTIPAPRMKMGLEHLVPLSRQAIIALQELRTITGNREYLFPSMSHAGKLMSMAVIIEGLELIGYKGKMSTHGFRALAMGVCKERLKYRHEVPDRQLAHVPEDEIERAYDRAKYLAERIEMMQRYADYLDNPTQQDQTQRKTLNEGTFNTALSYNYITTNYRVHTPAGITGVSWH